MILNYISKEYPDSHLVVTGDIAHDENMDTYKEIRKLLHSFFPNYRLLPGNHDNREAMWSVFRDLLDEDLETVNFSYSVGGWRLIGLDSHIPGELFGLITQRQLDWLNQQLSLHRAQPTILFVHHPPVVVGSPWLDKINLREPEMLYEVLINKNQVKAICTGHIHQEFEGQLNGIKVYGTPSTSIQFTPNTERALYDKLPPGFRIFEFGNDSFRTNIVRVGNTQEVILDIQKFIRFLKFGWQLSACI